MKEIQKIGILSLSKVSAIFGIIIGFLTGISYSLLSRNIELTIEEALQYIAQNPTIGLLPIFIALGWWSILVVPIIFGIIYFISGVILAVIYNLIAKFFGGIKIEFEEKQEKKRK